MAAGATPLAREDVAIFEPWRGERANASLSIPLA